MSLRRRLIIAAVALVMQGLVIAPAAVAGAAPEPASPQGKASTTSTIEPATSLPAGFSDQRLFGLTNPTAIAFTPDDRMLVTQDSGLLRVAVNDQLLSQPALNLKTKICSAGSRGLMGIAVDPKFSVNNFIYVFWTYNKSNSCAEGTNDTPVNRVSRYELGGDNHVVAGSAKVLIDNLPSPATDHNAGDLHFGKNGLLYVSVGDGGCQIGAPTMCGALNGNSRRLDIPNGKILRITRNGAVPATNPYVDAVGARRCTAPTGVQPGDGPCTETFASGLRNPFRFTIRPGTNQVWANDVGQDTWEEIDQVQAGRDYGWNIREGFCVTGSTSDCGPSGVAYADPEFAYDHSTNCQSITGSAFVPSNSWGDTYAGKYLFADFTCNSVYRLDPQVGGGYQAVPFFAADGPVELTFGPGSTGPALYYLEYFSNEVHRVTGPTP